MPHEDQLPTMPKKTGVSDGTSTFSTIRTVARRTASSNGEDIFRNQNRHADASTATRLRKLNAMIKNYDDTQFKGGNQGQAEAINRVRS